MTRRHIRTGDYDGQDRRSVVRFDARIRLADLLKILGLLSAGVMAYVDLREDLVTVTALATSNREAVSLLRQQQVRDMSEIQQELRLLREQLSLRDQRRNP